MDDTTEPPEPAEGPEPPIPLDNPSPLTHPSPATDPSPATEPVGRHAAPADQEPSAPPPRLVTRRRTLAGAALVIVGGAAGAGVAAARQQPTVGKPEPAVPPAMLVEALAAERSLIAGLSASARDAALHPIAVQLIADHQAHAHALAATLSAYPGAADQVTAPASPRRSRSDLRAAEQQASTAAARRAAALSGSVSALLASVAACEAAHAELLS